MHEMCVKVKSPCLSKMFALILLLLWLHVNHAHLGLIDAY